MVNYTLHMANTITLEGIFTSPLFWNGGKTCEFLTAAHKYIKDTSDKTREQFKEKLNCDAESPLWNLWNGEKDWRTVLEEEHFELVTTFLDDGNCNKSTEKTKPRKLKAWQTSSVVELLGIIRNKHEHNGQYAINAKRKLGWFQNVDGVFQFDPNLYAKYWNDRFPRLTLFLWIHFSDFQDVPTLKSFYPSNILNQFLDYSKLLNVFASVKEALQDQLDKGAAISRYFVSMNQVSVLLELRNLSANQITQLLDGNSALSTTICQNNVSCCWIGQKCYAKKFQTSLFINFPNLSECNICVSCVFASKITTLNESILEEVGSCKCGSPCTQVIVFTNHKLEEKCQFDKWVNIHFRSVSKLQVSLLDVSKPIREIVETQSEICFQECVVKLNSLLPVNIEIKNKCLDSLSGNVLNQILKGGNPKIFNKLKLPIVPKIYINRSLRKSIIFDSNIFELADENNIFVCLGISKEHFMQITDCKDEDVSHFKDLESDVQFTAKYNILHDSNQNEIHEACECFFKAKKFPTIHVVQFLQSNLFEWVHAYGSTFIFEQALRNFAKDKNIMTEDDFLDIFESLEISEKLVIIGDKPGMGKSVILANLATKLKQKHSKRLVVHANVSEFVAGLNKFVCFSRFQVESKLIEFICSTSFEKNLVRAWLKEAKFYSEPKIELMLDGFDEASDFQKTTAKKILQQIQTHCSAIRVWLTSRSHMLNELGSSLKSFGYKMIPLTVEDQVELIARLWVQYLTNKTNSQTALVKIEKLRTFAKRCIELPFTNEDSEVTGIPLLCRIIAEIYEYKVFQQDFTLYENTGLCSLYENMIARKLEIYLKEKCGLSALSLDHIIAHTMRDNFELWHVYFAIKLIFQEQTSAKFKCLLQTGSRSVHEIENALLQFGLIEKIFPISFIHRTFAEFIIARFAYYQVLNKSCFKLFQVDNAFDEFVWNEVLKAPIQEPDLSKLPWFHFHAPPSCRFSYPTINYFLNDLLRENYGNQRIVKSINILWKLADNLLKISAFTEDFVRRLPILAAARHANLESLFKFLLKHKKYVNGIMVMGLISQSHEDIKTIIQLGKYFQPDTWHEIQTFDKTRFGMIHWLFYKICAKNCWTSEHSLLAFLKYIATKSINVFEERDADGCTPLMMLVKSSYSSQPLFYKLIDFLICNLRVNTHYTYADNSTICHFVSMLSYATIGEIDVEILLKYEKLLDVFLSGEDNRYMLDVKNSAGHTPLLSCIQHFSAHRILCLLRLPDERDRLGYMLGCGYKIYCNIFIKILSLFHEYGANFNAKFFDGRTPLLVAIEEHFHIDVIIALIQFGSCLYAKNVTGQCALHFALISQDLELFLWLVENFAVDIYVSDYNGMSVVDYGILHFLVRQTCYYYNNAWNAKTIEKAKKVIKYVVDMCPASLEQRDSNGRTPLLVLTQEGSRIDIGTGFQMYAFLVSFFVNHLKANVNAIDNDGNTVLHFQYAGVFNRHKNDTYNTISFYLIALKDWCSTVWKLFQNNFYFRTLNKVNKQGKTALSIIIETYGKHPRVALEGLQLFLSVKADFSTTDRDGNTLLMLAIINGHDAEVVSYFIQDCKVKVDSVNFKGQCALSLAVEKRNVGIVKLLLENFPLHSLIQNKKMLTYSFARLGAPISS